MDSMPDELELWALLVGASALSWGGSHLLLKKIQWSPYTLRNLCVDLELATSAVFALFGIVTAPSHWDARRLRSAFADVAKALVPYFLAILRDAESRAVRELTEVEVEVEGLRMSLDEHHGRRSVTVPVKLRRTMEQARLN